VPGAGEKVAQPQVALAGGDVGCVDHPHFSRSGRTRCAGITKEMPAGTSPAPRRARGGDRRRRSAKPA
jgi:hypothetical protein